jgi:transcriptional antiterminator RfaH
MMNWYVIHTKPKQEPRALLNLERQGYECFLPMLAVEILRQGALTMVDEPLFPRYLFIHLDSGESEKGWGPIRSTYGVSQMVTFGNEPAQIDNTIVEALRDGSLAKASKPKRLFKKGEPLEVTKGPFAGLEAVYQMDDGESRVMVLIELLSKKTNLTVSPASVRKIG